MDFKKIAPLRKAAGYSQITFAESLGISSAAVSMWEIGQRTPRADMLPKIASLLHCKIDDLFSGDIDSANSANSA